MRSRFLGCTSASATVGELERTGREPRSAIVSVRLPAAPQDGHDPNHCSALAPHSEHTYAVFAFFTSRPPERVQ
jgi:hypothetical protein